MKTHYLMGWEHDVPPLCQMKGGSAQFLTKAYLKEWRVDCKKCLAKMSIKPAKKRK